MKRKRTKKFIRHIYVDNCYDFSQVAEVFAELGYYVQDDPSADGDCFFITNRLLTYGDFITFYKANLMDKMDDNPNWAEKTFGDRKNEYLDTVE